MTTKISSPPIKLCESCRNLTLSRFKLDEEEFERLRKCRCIGKFVGKRKKRQIPPPKEELDFEVEEI